MFSNLLFVRLKAAENALRDGRLDEAYRLATTPDLREHRRGGLVLSTLAEKFLDRARQHYRAERFTEAMMDLDRAEAGGVLQEAIAELRGQIRTVAAEVARREQTRRERLDAARRRIEDGSLVAGRRILEQASARDQDADRLLRAADQRASEAAAIVTQAEALIAKGQHAAAAARIRRARAVDAHGDAVMQVEAELCATVLRQARAALIEGKLSRASDELSSLGDLGESLPAKREMRDMLRLARESRAAIVAQRYGEARRYAMGLARHCPEAGWINHVIDHLKALDDLQTALSAGPLGDRMEQRESGKRHVADAVLFREAARGPVEPGVKAAALDDTVALDAIRADETAVDRLLMHVDGGGSYLIVLNGKASIGRAAANAQVEIPLFSDVSERQANLTRVDDDYFLFAVKEIEVAGQATRHQLLKDGDRVVLGKKAKFTFRLPSRKSPTAVLDLSDTTKMPHDVRRVIMFHRHATLGRSMGDHIRCQHAGTTLVLFERDGALWIRRRNDGHVDTEPLRITLGTPMELDGASFVVSPWPADQRATA
jgi:hypothetical protein